MKLAATFIIYLVMTFSGFAQAPAPQSGDPVTYQYIFRSRDAEEDVALTSAQLSKLEQLRNNDKVIFVKVSERTIIKLLPRNVIMAPGFPTTPLEEKLYFVELDMNEYYDIYDQAVNLE
jgi:hypothetical protein